MERQKIFIPFTLHSGSFRNCVVTELNDRQVNKAARPISLPRPANQISAENHYLHGAPFASFERTQAMFMGMANKKADAHKSGRTTRSAYCRSS